MDWLTGFYNVRVVASYLPQFASGFAITIEVSAAGLTIAIVLGTLIACVRVYGPIWISRIALAYVDVVRATPLLIQLYLLYFAVGSLPFVGRLSELQAGILALGLNASAYFSEIIRAGLKSVGRGQIEAARALGFSFSQAFRLVLLPQALKFVMPPLIGQTAMLIKDSSIVSFIGVVELTGAGVSLMSERLLPNEGFLTAAACYLLVYLIALGLTAVVEGHGNSRATTPARQW